MDALWEHAHIGAREVSSLGRHHATPLSKSLDHRDVHKYAQLQLWLIAIEGKAAATAGVARAIHERRARIIAM